MFKNKTRLILLIASTFFTFYSIKDVSAHSGRTDAYGCHNCYTDYCYGDYHCHNSGYVNTGYTAPRYTLPAPTTPKNANVDYKISRKNSCAYDVSISWDKLSNTDRYSITMTKIAGGNPGPMYDTIYPNYIFEEYHPGTWYINMKGGNSERWSDIVYWTVQLPEISPNLIAYISGNKLYYELNCLKEYIAPEFIVNYIDRTKFMQGVIDIPYTDDQEFEIEATGYNGKEYKKELNFKSKKVEPTEEPVLQDTLNEDNTGLAFLFTVFGIGTLLWLNNKYTHG